jgi:hypothetical protein
MSEEIDPLEKVAECARAIAASDDLVQQQTLTHLQALWANLATEKGRISDDEWGELCDGLARIHAKLIRRIVH